MKVQFGGHSGHDSVLHIGAEALNKYVPKKGMLAAKNNTKNIIAFVLSG